MPRSPLACVFVATLGLALRPTPTSALELSDLKLDFTNVSGATDPDAAGSLRLRAQGGEATLQIRLQGVDADPVQLCVFETESGPLVAQAELEPGGGTLASDAGLDFDPRTKYLTISTASDCSGGHLLAATLADPATCEPGSKTKLKIYERTALEAGAAAPADASAELLYHVLPDRSCKFANDPGAGPRRKARLSVRVKHALANASYDVWIDDDDKGALSTNSAGVGRSDFTFNQPKGNGQGSSKRLVIDFDAYASEVEIRDGGGTAVFFGTVLAPLCSEQELLTASLTGSVGSGQARFLRDEGCARVLEVSVQGLPDGSYAVAVGGTLAPFMVPAPTPAIVFSSDPEGSELPLSFDPVAGQFVEVLSGASPVLSGELVATP